MNKKVLVVSHERSGTHFLINSIASNFNLSPQWIDVHCKDYIDPGTGYIENYKSEIKQFFEKQYSLETNRIYKSHHQFGYFDGYFDDILEHFNVFYITRDVRDTLSSCYKYFNEAPVTAFPKNDNMTEFLFDTPPYLYPYDGAYSYVKSDNMIKRWAKHIESWKPVYDKITVLSYSDLTNNFDNTIKDIALTLGVDAPVVCNQPPVNSNSINPGKGIEGGWKEFMSEEISTMVLNEAGKELV